MKFNPKFSRFSNIRTDKSPQEITLEDFLREVRSDSHKVTCDFLRTSKDSDKAKKKKNNLPCVTLSAICKGGHGRKNMSSYSSLIQLDFDLSENKHLADRTAKFFAHFNLSRSPHVVSVFESPSGGLKAIVLSEAKNFHEHKLGFEAAQMWATELGLKGDPAVSDPSRAFFLSHDPCAHMATNIELLDSEIEGSEYDEDSGRHYRALPFVPLPIAEVKENLLFEPARPFNTKPSGKTSSDYPGRSQSEEVELAKSALQAIPKQKYPGWIRVCAAVWDAVGESDGTSLLQEWSYEPEGTENSYDAKYRNKLDDVGAGTLFQMAQDNGWSQPGKRKLAPTVDVDAILANAAKRVAKQKKEVPAESVELPSITAQPKKSAAQILDELDFSNEEALIARAKEARDQVFVLPGIAVRGQATVIYAAPNSGKTLLTLRLLHDQSEAGGLKDLNIYYCNFDDDFIGANEKAEYVKHLDNIKMLDNQKASPEIILAVMTQAIEDGSAGGMCLVLDTIIRFVSDCDRNTQREFNKQVQLFLGAQGTIIALGHTNKHKDASGLSVYGGTADIRNCFSQSAILELETEKDAEDRRVRFKNDKLRGMAKESTCYKYCHGDNKSWTQRVNTIERVEENEAREHMKQLSALQQRDADKGIIDFMVKQLTDGPKSFTVLERAELSIPNSGSKSDRTRVLNLYSTENANQEMQIWGKSKGQNGGWNYYLNDTLWEVEDLLS